MPPATPTPPEPAAPGPLPLVGAWGTVSRAARPVVRELLVNGPSTRTDLARVLGLSTGSLTRLTKPLTAAGLVVEGGTVHDPANGRPTRPLDVVAADHHFLGVKLTSDRLYAAVTDLRARVIAETSEPLDATTPEAVSARIAGVRERLTTADTAPVAAGVTLGGAARPRSDPDAAPRFDAPFLGWVDIELSERLTRRTGVPCVVENDVTALAHAQRWFGAARGLTDFALLTVGAGIGYALVRHGRMVPADAVDLREFSHHVLDPGGPMCTEGHRGCIASYLSTRSILAAAAHGLRRGVTPEEVAALARAGDPVCRNVLRPAAWALGAALATVANLCMVKDFVVAGEGLVLIAAEEGCVEAGIRDRRHRDHGSLRVTTLAPDFGEWARAAAVTAIRAFVLREE
ncbi:ROK family protein [Streptomyces xiamenensis]|uniref:ROK family protein n=1 Tax=Streptomyces xiamenensis TaxID=408015 RepID=A0A0F7FPX1_9ACTN|nr:ROK family transcriptional regulator [Streptomyces xiamenensis]AKG41447.1 ROK family protein [Streptomyces xiamenensis]